MFRPKWHTEPWFGFVRTWLDTFFPRNQRWVMPIQLLHLPVSDVHLCHINKQHTKLFKPQVMVLLTELTQNQKTSLWTFTFAEGTTMHTLFCFAPQHGNIAGNPIMLHPFSKGLFKVKGQFLYPSHFRWLYGGCFLHLDSTQISPRCHILQNRKTCHFQSKSQYVGFDWQVSWLTFQPFCGWEKGSITMGLLI